MNIVISKYQYAVYLMSILLLFASCSNGKSPSSIPVETVDDKYYLDAIADSMNYILLEESSIESFVGSIYGVQMDDGKLFVAHNPGSRREEDQIISVYDLDGHYLNRIGRKGRARNEFIQIKSWCLDIERNEVLILDNSSHAIKRYAYDGTYLSQISLPDYQYIERMDGKIVVFSASRSNGPIPAFSSSSEISYVSTPLNTSRNVSSSNARSASAVAFPNRIFVASTALL